MYGPIEQRRTSCPHGRLLTIVGLVFSTTLFCHTGWSADEEVQLTPVVLQITAAGGSDRPLPCHVYLKDSAGQPVQVPDCPFWIDHFACDGQVVIRLPPDDYTYELDRGPEYALITGRFRVEDGRPQHVARQLERRADLAAEGWYSGETHVHRPLEQIELIMQAADLHVAEVITWWNNTNLWQTRPVPEQTVVRFDGNRFYDQLAGEDERGGGAVLFFRLPQPLAIAGARREYPSAVKFLEQARKHPSAWIDVEKPFWWDVPVWLATGNVNSIGLIHNHLQRDGMLENEAWGRARDRAKFPAPLGNGPWTQEIYFHILNCGLRIPPTAGSASGVLRNPLGYNRAYVHVGRELTYDRWWQCLKAGRVFVTNGPLLRVRANGQLPGHVFRSSGPLTVSLDGKLDSRDPIAALEFVQNGVVEPIQLPCDITIRESGWFLLRATADVSHTYRIACTGPFYVEIDGRAAKIHPASARFFLDWVRQRIQQLPLDRPLQREEILEPLLAAERFWLRRLAEANAGR